MAMRMEKHCYCEKPLAHSVFETRTLTNIAREKETGHANGDANSCREELPPRRRVGAGGRDRGGRRAHVWIRADFRGPPQPTSEEQRDAPADRPPVPKNLDWDLWLGPAAYRPYHPAYVPFNWRFWWAFGNGLLGVFFCHYSDLVFWCWGSAIRPRSRRTVPSIRRVRPNGRSPARNARPGGALPPVGGSPGITAARTLPG